jgi:CubicO group peptidase (beta-lactamase class C family)
MRVYVRGEGANMITEPLERDPTIKDLLLHTAGLTYGQSDTGNPHPVDSMLNAFEIPFMSLDAFVDKVTSVPLLMQPGKKWHYSFSYDIIGYVIQKVTREPVDQWFARNIFLPLGMTDTGFYVPAEKVGRYATAYMEGQPGVLTPISAPLTSFGDLQSYNSPAFISLGAGIVSTALDYAKFAQCLLDGGILDGVRILKSETVDIMWRNQLPLDLLPIHLQGWTSNDETGFGLGFTVSTAQKVTELENKWDLYTGENRIGNIAWGGGQMTNWIASKDGDFVITFMTQRIGDIGTFHQLLVGGVWAAVTGYSPRQLNAMNRNNLEIKRETNRQENTIENNLRLRRGSKQATNVLLQDIDRPRTDDIPIGQINPQIEIGIGFSPSPNQVNDALKDDRGQLKPTATGIDESMSEMGLDVIDFVNPTSLFEADEAALIEIINSASTEKSNQFEMIDDLSLINQSEEVLKVSKDAGREITNSLIQEQRFNENKSRKLESRIGEEDRLQIESMNYKKKGKGKGKGLNHPDPRVAAHLAEVEQRKRAIYEQHGLPYPGDPYSHPQSGSLKPSLPGSSSLTPGSSSLPSSSSLPTSPIGGSSGVPSSSNLSPVDAIPIVTDLLLNDAALSAAPNSANSPIPIPSSADLGSSLPAIISATSGVSNNNYNNPSWEDVVRNENRNLQSSSDLGVIPPIVKKVATNKVQKKMKKTQKDLKKDAMKVLHEEEKRQRKQYKDTKQTIHKSQTNPNKNDSLKVLRDEEKERRQDYKDVKKDIRKGNMNPAITPIPGSSNSLPSSPTSPISSGFNTDIAQSASSIIPIIAPLLDDVQGNGNSAIPASLDLETIAAVAPLLDDVQGNGNSAIPASLDLETIAGLGASLAGSQQGPAGNGQSWEEIVSQSNFNNRLLQNAIEDGKNKEDAKNFENEQTLQNNITVMNEREERKKEQRRIRERKIEDQRNGPLKKMKSALEGAMSWFSE